MRESRDWRGERKRGLRREGESGFKRRERKSKGEGMRLPRGKEKKGRQEKLLRDKERLKRTPRDKRSWRRLRERRGRRRERLRREWQETGRENVKRGKPKEVVIETGMMIVTVAAAGGLVPGKTILLAAKMMVQGQEEEEVVEHGSQELAAGGTGSRGSRRSGDPRVEMMVAGEMRGGCLQDVDLLRPGTGTEEMQELGGVADLPGIEMTLLPGDSRMMDRGQEDMVAATLETEIATMIGRIEAGLAVTIETTTVVDLGTTPEVVQEMTLEVDQEDLHAMVLLAEMLDLGDVEEGRETLEIEIVVQEDLLMMTDLATGAVDLQEEMIEGEDQEMTAASLLEMRIDEDPEMMREEDQETDLQPENLMTAGPRSTNVRDTSIKSVFCLG